MFFNKSIGYFDIVIEITETMDTLTNLENKVFKVTENRDDFRNGFMKMTVSYQQLKSFFKEALDTRKISEEDKNKLTEPSEVGIGDLILFTRDEEGVFLPIGYTKLNGLTPVSSVIT